VEIDGATFYYRRVPANIRNRMMRSCTTSHRTGHVDWGRYEQMLMEYALLGWENVHQRGAAVPFSKELIAHIPDRAQGELVILFSEHPERRGVTLSKVADWLRAGRPHQSRRGKRRAEK